MLCNLNFVKILLFYEILNVQKIISYIIIFKFKYGESP